METTHTILRGREISLQRIKNKHQFHNLKEMKECLSGDVLFQIPSSYIVSVLRRALFSQRQVGRVLLT